MIAILLALAGMAEEERVHLVFVRDRGVDACPADDDLMDRVRARVGSEPFRDDDGGREVRVGIARDGSALVARVAMFSPNGTRLGVRVIRGDRDCESLAADLALAIAIAVDPLLFVRPRAPPPRADVETAALRDGDASLDDLKRVPSPPPEEPSGGLPLPATIVGRAMLGVADGVGIIATPTTRASVTLGYGALGFDIGGRFDLPSHYPIGRDTQLDTVLVAATSGLCLIGDIDVAVSVRGCGAGEVGWLQVHPDGDIVELPGDGAPAPWLAAGASAALDVHIAPGFGLFLAGNVLAPILRPRFVDDVTQQVYEESAPVVWDLALGAEVQIR